MTQKLLDEEAQLRAKTEKWQRHKNEADKFRERLGTLQDSLRRPQRKQTTTKSELKTSQDNMEVLVVQTDYISQLLLDEREKLKGKKGGIRTARDEKAYLR
jgi:hypothetical protein